MANKPLKSIKFPGLDDTYTVAVTDTTFSEEGAPADAKATGDALETKADKDGYYTDLTAGTAEQLLASQSVEDKIPYLFRTSGGSIDIGNRETDKIVGGSIVWNQLVLNGDFSENIGWSLLKSTDVGGIADGIITVTPAEKNGGVGQTTALNPTLSLIASHIYLLCADIKSASDYDSLRLILSDNSYYSYYKDINTTPEWQRYSLIVKLPDVIGASHLVAVRTMSQDSFVEFSVDNVVLFDLTAMLAPNISDYIYSLEQASTGAGVAWFKALFPKPYYEYNAGELLSVSDLQSHDTVGVNLWDEEWEVGGFDQYGEPSSDSGKIRSKNYIRVIPGATYYCKSENIATYVFGYDINQSFVGIIDNTSLRNRTFSVPENVYFIKLRVGDNSHPQTTYNNDICLNLSWSGYRNGEYEPYEKHSYPLDSSLTLRGVPKLDAENNLYYDGDEYVSDGTVTRRYGVIDLGTLSWNEYGGAFSETHIVTRQLAGKSAGNFNIICSGYATDATGSVNAMVDRTIKGNASGTNLYIKDMRFNDVQSLTAALSGVYLVYELATPTTEEAEPYINPQIVDDFGTEEYVTTSLVPVGHETMYPANLRDKLQHLPDLAENDGYYAIKQEGSQLSLELFRIPKAPTTDGNYTLKATVTGGVPTYTWESEGE